MHGFLAAVCLNTVLFCDAKSIGGVRLSVNETIEYDTGGAEKGPDRKISGRGLVFK